MASDDDTRDRLIRLETKQESVTRDIEWLIQEVKSVKLDVQDIKLTLAKYLGGFLVVVAIIEVLVKKFA
jgi:hypothetical protein